MKLVKIGDIAEQIRGVSYKPIDVSNEPQEGKIPLLRSNNIHDAVIDYTDVIYVNRSVVSPQQMLIPGDVLICASSGSKNLVGKASLVIEKKGSFGAFCKVLRLHENDGNRYFYHFFCSPHYRTMISNLSTGANINNIRNEHLDEMYIPWPEIGERVQKGKILDTITSLISLRRQQLEKLNQLAKSQFIEMFGDPERNEHGYALAPFNSFATIDAHMTTEYEKYADYPHIGIDSIEKNTGRLFGYRTVKEDGVRSGKYYFSPAHIIYSKIRPNLNKVALPSFEGLCSADSYPILPNAENCNRVYLAFVLRSNWFLKYIIPLSGRSNMPKVNREQLNGFSWPLPPKKLQDQFASVISPLDKSKFAIEESIRKLELLYRSKLQEFFG